MNNTPDPSIEELQQQVRSLRILFLATLAVLVLLTFALNVFIFRQVSIASKQAEENQKIVDDYNKVTVPMITDFLTKLTVISKTNADIGRLLTKYNVQQPAPQSGAPSLSPLPAPAPATTPKK